MKKFVTGLSAILSLLTAAILWPWQWIGLIVMITISVLILYNSTKTEKKLFGFCAVFGAGAEVIAIILGSWTYTNPTFIIPLWLIPLWGIAGVFMSRMKTIFEEMEQTKKKTKSKK